MYKKTLRQEVRNKKANLSNEQIEHRSNILLKKLLATEEYLHAVSLYAYVSFNQEVRTASIIMQAWSDGKHVAVPKVVGSGMSFYWINSFEDLVPNTASHISEPKDGLPVADDETALVLMPGLAFDHEGHRIGYGGGYYDRFLTSQPRHPTIALCYDFQLYEKLQTENHDVSVDLVISDQ